MISIRSQTLLVSYCIISFIWPSGKDKTIGAEIGLVIARSWKCRQGIACKAGWRDSLMWWKCSISYLDCDWLWLPRHLQLSKLVKLLHLKMKFIVWNLYLNKSDLKIKRNKKNKKNLLVTDTLFCLCIISFYPKMSLGKSDLFYLLCFYVHII